MKLDWDKLPDWANFAAKDSKNRWYLYELLPTAITYRDGFGYWRATGGEVRRTTLKALGITSNDSSEVDWGDSLQERGKDELQLE